MLCRDVGSLFGGPAASINELPGVRLETIKLIIDNYVALRSATDIAREAVRAGVLHTHSLLFVEDFSRD
jgi:hypothetical protein